MRGVAGSVVVHLIYGALVVSTSSCSRSTPPPPPQNSPPTPQTSSADPGPAEPTPCETLPACERLDGELVRVTGTYRKFEMGFGRGREWRGHVQIDLGEGGPLLGRYWHEESKRPADEVAHFDGARVTAVGRYRSVTPPNPDDPEYAAQLSTPALVEVRSIELADATLSTTASQLPACEPDDERPLSWVCWLGRGAAQVDLGCERPRVLRGSRATLPSYAGFACQPPADPDVITLAFVPWTDGPLGHQSYDGMIEGVSRSQRVRDPSVVAELWRDDRARLIALGCESVALEEAKREHLLCGEDWEASIGHVMSAYTVTAGTTRFFDLEYAGRHGETLRSSRSEW